MPGATTVSEGPATPNYDIARTKLDKPLEYTGSLDSYSQSDLTPVIGTEFEGLQVVDLLSAKNSDALIRDLAVTVSQRGVVFLRNQDVTPQQMRELMERITVLAGSVSLFAPLYSDFTDRISNSQIHPAYMFTHSPRKEASSAIRSA
jgi:alpha-ketoglutarate-dependent taurine dioxygenase